MREQTVETGAVTREGTRHETDRIAILEERAARLRIHSLRATSEAGSGHPSSCLSAADLVAALFFEFLRYDPSDPGNPAADRFILSKGHAAPLLYAAWAEAGAFPVEKLLTLRRFDSELEGHPTPRFSGTVAATGSLGQGLSVGVGVAWNAKQLDRSDQRAYVLLGDGEMAEGSVWEAVETAAHYRLDNLIAIADVNGLGQSQGTMLGHDVETFAARFRSFGWDALTIDGHDMRAVVGAYEQALGPRDRPVAIVARTRKGQGVSLLTGPDNWHGKALKKGEQLDHAIEEIRSRRPPIDVPPPRRAAERPAAPPVPSAMPAPSYKLGEEVATREAYGTALAKLGQVNPRIVVLDGDTKNSTFAERFLAAHPDRYFEAFIAEQNMVGTAVGLSASGKVPFTSTFACFFTRAFDHIRMAAISRATLKIAGSHCGVSIGEDGPSQMGLEDLAMMRAVPDAVVLYPADAVATERLAEAMSLTPGIHYLRLTRPKTPVLYPASEQFPVGGSKLLRRSAEDAVTIVAAGITVLHALEAHDRLAADGIHVRVLDAYSVKPIDAVGIVASAEETRGRIVVVEDHYYEGGLGDAVLNAVMGHPFRVAKLAVREVPRSGKPDELVRAYGIDADAIVDQVRALVAHRE